MLRGDGRPAGPRDSGTWEPLQLLPPTLAIVGYALRSRTLSAQGRPVPLARQLSFAGGMVLVFAALVSPTAHLGEELLLGHMAQHLLMADIGALLIVLGVTGPLLQPLLGLPVVGRLRFVHPLVALPLWIADLYVWHLPGLYQAALSSEAIHALQHATVFFGITMWMALLGPCRSRSGSATEPSSRTSSACDWRAPSSETSSSGPRAPSTPTTAPARTSGTLPLSDQGVAGTIMMIEGSLVTIVLFGWLFMKAAHEAEERQLLLEYAEQHGIDLSESRAARAAGAGRGAELRRRLERAAQGRDKEDRHGGRGGDRPGRLRRQRRRHAAGSRAAGPRGHRRLAGALNASDYVAAASYFADEALVDQGQPFRVYGARTPSCSTAACPAAASSATPRTRARTTLAVFRLRAGPGRRCSGSVRVRFTIARGKFQSLRQLPEREPGPVI